MSSPIGRGPGELLSRAYEAWQKRDLFAAIRFVEKALAQDPAASDLAKGRLLGGSFYRELGDTIQAKQHLLALLAQPHPDPERRPVYEAYALYNLGLTHRMRREYLEAVECYRRAAELFREQLLFGDVRAALQNLAWVLCLLERGDEAAQALEEAAPLVSEADPEGALQQRLGCLFAMLVDQDYPGVLDSAPGLIHDAEGYPQVQTQAALLAGRAYYATGFLDEAAVMAGAAHEWATDARDHRGINDAIQLKRDIAARRERGA